MSSRRNLSDFEEGKFQAKLEAQRRQREAKAEPVRYGDEFGLEKPAVKKRFRHRFLRRQ